MSVCLSLPTIGLSISLPPDYWTVYLSPSGLLDCLSLSLPTIGPSVSLPPDYWTVYLPPCRLLDYLPPSRLFDCLSPSLPTVGLSLSLLTIGLFISLPPHYSTVCLSPSRLLDCLSLSLPTVGLCLPETSLLDPPPGPLPPNPQLVSDRRPLQPARDSHRVSTARAFRQQREDHANFITKKLPQPPSTPLHEFEV